jgi:lipoate-protein ligase B
MTDPGEAAAPVQVVRTGRLDYLPSWDLQRRLARARRQGLVPDLLLLVEHPPTYTIGRSGSRDNLLIDEATLAAVGATCLEVDRGGDITFHGPGQIVAYAIVDLGSAQRAVRRYVERLERTVIGTLATYGVEAVIEPRYPGVWVDREKIAALGIAVSRGVTYHGFALNVDPDLRYFGYMIPCGIVGRGATSLARLLGHAVSPDETAERLIASFSEVFQREVREDLTLADLEQAAEAVVAPT